MPTSFKKEFIANGCVAHVTKRQSGKHTSFYEIRYRRNGFNVSAGSTCLETAKKRFLDKLIEETQNAACRGISRLSVENVAHEWLDCRRGCVDPLTLKHYASYYERNIKPFIGTQNITRVRSADLNALLLPLRDRGRAYEDTRSVLNQIFVYAQNNGIITHNPVKAVAFIRYERKHGSALTRDEIRRVLDSDSKYRGCWILQLFCGLRPCEVETARIENGFVVAKNAKRKGGKTEHKRIPIPAEADLTECKANTQRSNIEFKKLFPARTQYDLRHTFSTVCQMYVRREIVEIWLGDSPERLIGNTYTHFSDEFMRAEMAKVRFLPDEK